MITQTKTLLRVVNLVEDPIFWYEKVNGEWVDMLTLGQLVRRVHELRVKVGKFRREMKVGVKEVDNTDPIQAFLRELEIELEGMED